MSDIEVVGATICKGAYAVIIVNTCENVNAAPY